MTEIFRYLKEILLLIILKLKLIELRTEYIIRIWFILLLLKLVNSRILRPENNSFIMARTIPKLSSFQLRITAIAIVNEI